jgi:hypothetical protein
MAAAIGCTRHGIENPYHTAHRRYPALNDRAWQ